MRTTLFGKKLIESAEEVLQIGYRAGNRNGYGEKLEQVVKEFDAVGGSKYFVKPGAKLPDYCGITVSVIIDRAMKKHNGTTNKYRSASAAYFKNNASAFGLRVDKIPKEGSLFLTQRSGGSGFHVGFVWKIEGDTIHTIEGNSYSGVHVAKDGCTKKLDKGEYGIMSRARSLNGTNWACFVHTEEMFDTVAMDFPSSAAYLADESEACDVEGYGTDEPGEDGDNNLDNPDENITVAKNKDKLFGLIPEEYKSYIYLGVAVTAVTVICFAVTNK